VKDRGTPAHDFKTIHHPKWTCCSKKAL